MRRLLSGSLGLGVALSAGTAAGQGPAPQANPHRPAARLVAVQALPDPGRGGPTARSQAGDSIPQPMPPGAPMPGAPAAPMSPAAPAAGAPAVSQLGPPRPFGQGPNVTELRNGSQPPPPLTFVPPTPGVAVPVGVPHPAAGVPVAGPDGGLFPCPDLDAPLFGGCHPGGAAATSAFNKWWLSAEYLMWWTRPSPVPILLTTGPAGSNGILGQPGTTVLFGNQSFSDTLHSGGRFGIGRWFGCEQRWGAEGSVFFLGRNTQGFDVDTGTASVIARPFTNLNAGVPFSQVIAAPGLATGTAAVRFDDSVWGAEANLRRFVTKTCCARLDLLAGFRYLQVNENLRIVETFARTPNSPTSIGVPNAVSGIVQDSFRTENHFFGGQLGLAGEARRGRWFTTLTGKVAFGSVFQSVSVAGRQDIRFADGTTQAFPGGLLALPGANMGRHTRSQFAVVPEVGVNVGYHLTPHCRVFVGYTFLYLSSALRPGDQIDPGLDVTRIPNFPVPGATPLQQARPGVPFRDRDFYAQGLNFGLQFTW